MLSSTAEDGEIEVRISVGESVAVCTNRRYDGYDDYRPTIQPQVEQPYQQYIAGQLIVFMDHLSSEQLVDCTLSCQGQFLKAHKMVLSACSPYFQELFRQHQIPHPIIIMNGMKFIDIKLVVEFMYRGEIKVLEAELEGLLAAAETLQVKGLSHVRTKYEKGDIQGSSELQQQQQVTVDQPPASTSPDTNPGSGPTPLDTPIETEGRPTRNCTPLHLRRKRRKSPHNPMEDPLEETITTLGDRRSSSGNIQFTKVSVNDFIDDDDLPTTAVAEKKSDSFITQMLYQISRTEERRESEEEIYCLVFCFKIKVEPPEIRDIDEENSGWGSHKLVIDMSWPQSSRKVSTGPSVVLQPGGGFSKTSSKQSSEFHSGGDKGMSRRLPLRLNVDKGMSRRLPLRLNVDKGMSRRLPLRLNVDKGMSRRLPLRLNVDKGMSRRLPLRLNVDKGMSRRLPLRLNVDKGMSRRLPLRLNVDKGMSRRLPLRLNVDKGMSRRLPLRLNVDKGMSRRLPLRLNVDKGMSRRLPLRLNVDKGMSRRLPLRLNVDKGMSRRLPLRLNVDKGMSRRLPLRLNVDKGMSRRLPLRLNVDKGMSRRLPLRLNVDKGMRSDFKMSTKRIMQPLLNKRGKGPGNVLVPQWHKKPAIAGKIPRPPNAFMIFANEWRRKLAYQYPDDSNKDISCRLGVMWKNMSVGSKEGYYTASRAADVEHKRKYPGYYYSPMEARLRKHIKHGISAARRSGRIPRLPKVIPLSDPDFLCLSDLNGKAARWKSIRPGRPPGRKPKDLLRKMMKAESASSEPPPPADKRKMEDGQESPNSSSN
uniref:Uncharacterized protein n=1 Tax=Timema shepardi TaxID=629360 RepID=A0A7R9B1H2_TIMSH|nr:unnamed protein product [Timema shepardi]